MKNRILKNILKLTIATLTIGGSTMAAATLVSCDNEQEIINAASIVLNKTSLTLEEGKYETLTATINPYNVTNKYVTWSSSNPSIASVDQNGKVIGITTGYTEVIATTIEGNKTASCQVYVIASTSSTAYLKFEVIDNSTCSVKFNTSKQIPSSGIVVIPETTTILDKTYTVTTIKEGAFKQCYNLKNIVIPNTITTIEDDSFTECRNLTTLNIPASVTDIGHDAFHYCSSLTSITVDENNKYFDSRDNCNAIIETSTNNLGVGCKNTNIPDGVRIITHCSFIGCTGLNSITIPNGVQIIEYEAFCDCTYLNRITIPESVTNIIYGAFWNCTNLREVMIDSSEIASTSSASSGSSLTSYAEYVYIKEGLEVGTHITDNFDKQDYSFKEGYVQYNKKHEVTKVEINSEDFTLTLNGVKEKTLTATVYPETASNKNITWGYSDSRVATVDSSGKVTAIGVGTATILARSNENPNVSDSVTVTVLEN